jgi:hypothetical protein
MKPVLYRYKNSESVIPAMDGYDPGEGWTPLYEAPTVIVDPSPVAYQYYYPDGFWRVSNAEEINGCRPTASRALYAEKEDKP